MKKGNNNDLNEFLLKWFENHECAIAFLDIKKEPLKFIYFNKKFKDIFCGFNITNIFENNDNLNSDLKFLINLIDKNKHVKHFFVKDISINKGYKTFFYHLFINRYKNYLFIRLFDKRNEKYFQKIGENILSLISHELRTPLTIALGYLELKELFGDKSQEIKGAIKELNKLNNIINKIITVSDLTKGNVTFELNKVNIVEILKEVLIELNKNIIKKVLYIKKNFEDLNDIFIIGDRVHLKQLFFEIIDNAIKFNYKEGYIDIKLEVSNGEVIIKVKNSSKLLQFSEPEKLIYLLKQVEDVNTRSHSGLGIGLYYAKLICLAHKGDFIIEKDEENELKVTIKFPLTKTKDKINIVVVEDEKDIRELYSIMLEGYNPKLFENGLKFLEFFENNKNIDLIFMDINLPDKNGIELSKHVLKIAPWIKICFVTAYTDLQRIKNAFKIGAFEYIIKPFTKEQLKVIIEKIYV